jgi:hypothetical protein
MTYSAIIPVNFNDIDQNKTEMYEYEDVVFVRKSGNFTAIRHVNREILKDCLTHLGLLHGFGPCGRIFCRPWGTDS